MSVAGPTVWGASVYPRRAASTRLRLDLLRGPLQRRGFQFQVWSYLPNGDFDAWIDGGPGRIAPALRGVPRTMGFLRDSRSASIVVVQREILPWNTLRAEFELARRGPVIWDVDDAMWLSASGWKGRIRGSASKYSQLARLATEVWAGNETVAEWCTAQGARVVRIVPTVTPLPACVGTPEVPKRLVWVGSQSTSRYLHKVLIEHRESFVGWTIEVVGGDIPAIPGLSIDTYDWSPDNEHRALCRAWAGIYPIDTTHEFAAGKSALKAILMAAYGIPVVGTRTRSNAAVIDHGVTGLLVDRSLGWDEALRALRDEAVRSRLGTAARLKATREYDPVAWGGYLAEVVMGLAGEH